jgi:hypothetical protein
LRTFRWKLDDRQYLPLGERDQPERVGAGRLPGAGLVDPGGELVRERVSAVRAPRVDRAEVLAVLRRLEEQAPGDLDDVPVDGNDAGSGRHAVRRHRTVARRADLGPDPVVPRHRPRYAVSADTLDGSSYDTSCATWLASIGRRPATRQAGDLHLRARVQRLGQYPWAQGDTGSRGASPCTPPQWIAAWDAVQAQIDGNGSSQYVYWMWAPNADTGGSTVNFTPWWPGASSVDMAGVDGYPQSGPGWGLCNFQELFGQSFTEMKSPTSLPIFISETDLAPLSTSQDCNGGSYETITGGPRPVRPPYPRCWRAPATGKQPAVRTGESSWSLMHSGMAEAHAPARTGVRATLWETSGRGYPGEGGTVTLPWVIAGAVAGLLAGPPILAVVFAGSTTAGQPPRRERPDCSSQMLPDR